MLDVKVIVEIAAKSGKSYWRRGNGKTLKEALVNLLMGGQKGGGKVGDEQKETVKSALCWSELGLKERKGLDKAANTKSNKAMQEEFLGKKKKKKLKIRRVK